MASSHTVRKNEVYVVECAICCEIYRDPKILIKCGHTFCDQCIKEMQGNSSKVKCPICRKVTEAPAGSLPPNFVAQDMAEPLRKQEETIKERRIKKETTKSVEKFYHRVSSVCQNMNEKLEQWKSISEILNGIAAKSFEVIETTETMDIDKCFQILKDIEKMTIIITDIATDCALLRGTDHMRVLQTNNDNIFIRDMNIQLGMIDTDLSSLSIEEVNGVKEKETASGTSTQTEIITNQVLVIGGYDDSSNCLKSLELYNPKNTYTNQLLECKLHNGRISHIAAILSDTLYVVGGNKSHYTHALKTMELFDPIRHQWLGYGPEMNRARTSFAGVVVQNQLMVFGGWPYASSNSCESFDPITQGWSPLPDMYIGREGHAGVQLNDEVYLIGGYDGHTISSSVSIFDPNASTWTSGPSMHQTRLCSAIAKFDNVIVVSGGYNGTEGTLRNCELLDSRQNKWMEIAPMKQERSDHVLVNCNGKLLAMGGEDNIGRSCSCVEEYDPQANQWHFVESMKRERSSFSAVTIS